METRNLAVKLTREELEQRADQMATLVAELCDAEDRKKISAKMIGDEIKQIQVQLGDIAAEVRHKEQVREVAVIREKDLHLGFESVIRSDTGEEIERRALEPSERQAELHLMEDPADTLFSVAKEAAKKLRELGVEHIKTTTVDGEETDVGL